MTNEELIRFIEDGDRLRLQTKLYLESLEKELNKERKTHDTPRTSLHKGTITKAKRARV